MIWLLLLASLANAQSVSTNTDSGPSIFDDFKASNDSKDIRAVMRGRYVQTGKPTFKNGFCFGDGTCQPSAYASDEGVRVALLESKVSSMQVTTDSLGAANPPYSAVCDGSTDDSVAIQSCVNDSATYGIPCMLPGKNCAFGNNATNSHVILSMPQGASLIGYGVSGKGSTNSQITFNSDGNGQCTAGSNGNIRIIAGNGIATIRGLTLTSNNSSANCIINASTDSSHQIGNFTLERVGIYPKSGATQTSGLFMGNVVRSRILNNYFSPGFVHDVVDVGSFMIATQFQKNTFDGPLVSSNTEFAVILSSGVSAVDFSDNIFEPHPNGIKVLDGYGVTIKGNWFGDIRSNQGGTLIDYAGSGGMITGNSINANDHDTDRIDAIHLSGRGGNTVSGNWIDAANIAVRLNGPGNTVVGNEIFTPAWIGVYIDSYTSNNVGPNKMTIGAGGGRMPFYCVALASGNYITSETGSQNGARSSCYQSNIVSNAPDTTLYGYSYVEINSTSSVPGQGLVMDTHGYGSTYGSYMMSIINGPGGNADGNRTDIERNSGNNGPFRNGTTYADLNFVHNTTQSPGAGKFGGMNFLINRTRFLKLGGGDDYGYVFIGSAPSVSSFNSLGSLFMAPNSSVTLTGPSGYLTAGSSVNAPGFFGNTASIATSLYASTASFGTTDAIRSDALINITGAQKGISINDNSASATGTEGFMTIYGKDSAASWHKRMSISSYWADNTATTAYGNLRFNATYGGGDSDDVWLVGWGNHGAAFWPPDSTAAFAPGANILKVNGSIIVGSGGTPLSIISTGTYTPTMTGVSNVTGTGSPTANYIRIGNKVIVHGSFDLNATAATNTQFGISLPISSNFTATKDLEGNATCLNVATWPVGCRADSTNDRADCYMVTTAAGVGSNGYQFQFIYEIK